MTEPPPPGAMGEPPVRRGWPPLMVAVIGLLVISMAGQATGLLTRFLAALAPPFDAPFFAEELNSITARLAFPYWVLVFCIGMPILYARRRNARRTLNTVPLTLLIALPPLAGFLVDAAGANGLLVGLVYGGPPLLATVLVTVMMCSALNWMLKTGAQY